MRILGIVAEYNPFHKGHLYHLKQAQALIKPDVTIVVMSGSFVQRGEVAIVDKWIRSQIAVECGVDLVVELPTVYALESADYFAKSSIELLHLLGVTDIVFGSETANMDQFIEIAKTIQTNSDTYNKLVKEAMQKGLRYPDACNQALSTLMNQEVKTPNDLLGLAYTKEVITNNYPIHLHAIKRTSHYHSETIETFASATALRKALKENKDVSNQLPGYIYYKDKPLLDMNAFFPYLKYNILINNRLSHIHLVDEGIENLLKEAINKAQNTNELISLLSSKRYTRSRIARMLAHILLNNSKEEVLQAMHFSQIRPLAFSQDGANYLRQIKKSCPLPITTKILNKKDPMYHIEAKATNLIGLVDQELLVKEKKSIPYIKRTQE
ncbi:nucleotidyltransferase [Sharpea porci]|uniref:nucleotidyltransferase n=1 Tax=Sharpea porci TaxID=2652286 RepID=UPI002A90B12C|nr:nucleotidyltransferase [Sharpea porci]MDY5279645.1 nucleotidyltransferase [Sharpea porci]